jgi:hypothetical protein
MYDDEKKEEFPFLQQLALVGAATIKEVMIGEAAAGVPLSVE